jgi:AcrR family transcriptional regulator
LLKTGDEGAVSIRAIADAVGVTPPSIYLHFPDKEALILAVCTEHFAQLSQASDQAVAGIDDPMARIEARGRAYITFGLEHTEPYRIMFMTKWVTGMRMSDEQLADTAAFDHLVDDVNAAIAARQIGGHDAFTIACGLWAMVHGMTSLLIAKPDFPWPPLDEFIQAAMSCTSLSVAPPHA